MVSLAFENAPSHMVGLLEGGLHALMQLRAAADRLRLSFQPQSGSPRPLFSANEVEQLCVVIERGWNAMLQRVRELSPHDHDARAARWLEHWRTAPAGLSVAASPEQEPVGSAQPDPHLLLATYRASCRALCAALTEARHVADTITAAMLSGVLQRLEKQLWLLDSSREREHPRLDATSAVKLFLSC